MEILIAGHSGFCEGVERAFKIAVDTAKAGQPVFMLGNLVHNKQVVEKLKNQGVKTVSSVAEIPANSRGSLLISAHGVAPEIYQEAESKKLKIIDTTCPWVKKAQKIARELAAEGRPVIIVGDKGHPEVEALVGWSGGRGIVVEQTAELDKLALNPGDKVGIIAQTTQAEKHFSAMVTALKNKLKDVKEFDTICGATSKRQAAAIELARQVNLMLVIGDSMSANTKRLTELCSETGTTTHQIETAAGLDKNWLTGKKKVGVTAGASTPEWVIAEVIEKLKSRGGL
ncbi:MAG: 4-hydroxy-3-methylbut-2-enyl diphosphate reductase [Candidatus Margulisiibacteriota bacterium]